MIAAVFYGVIPISGGFYKRSKWRRFRNRFDELRLSPLLNYRQYRQLGNDGGVFRFTGELESITGETLWVRGENLTIPVSLKKTKCFLLPIYEGETPETPEQIRWNRVSTITDGAKVFIGGQIKNQNDRLNFCSTKENPLMVIFYNCPDSELTSGIIRSARARNEYWNNFTMVSIAIGAISLIYTAVSLLDRPALRLNVIGALTAVFAPILQSFPPSYLFTILYRRMTWDARNLRAYWDLARLPMRFLQPEQESGILSTGEKYGFVKLDSLPDETTSGTIPFLIPEDAGKERKQPWYFFGVLDGTSSLPQRSKDPFVSFGILPTNPSLLVRRYAIRSYTLEVFAWLILLLGICVNIIFIFIILFLLGVIS